MAPGVKLLCVDCNIVTEAESDYSQRCPDCGQDLSPEDNRVPDHVEVGRVSDERMYELLNLH